jgi:NAD(P)H dehydrogenase (quinone)
VTVVVAGASGMLGRQAAALLLPRLPPGGLVLVTRTPERLRELEAAGAEVRRGDYGDPDSLRKAFAGGERLLMISAPAAGGADTTPLHETAIEIASEAGIRKIAYTSFANPAEDNPAFPSEPNRATERALRESGLAFTALRNAIYSDIRVEIAPFYVGAGRWTTNLAEGRHAFIWRADCAAAAAAAVLDESDETAALELTGPELISAADFVELLEEFGGRRMRLDPVGDDEYRAYFDGLSAEYGEDAPFELHWTTGRAIREGKMDQLSDSFRALTGSSPRSLRELFEANRRVLGAAAG